MRKGTEPGTILNESEIRDVIQRFAQEIVSTYPDLDQIAVVGIQTGGAHLGRRLVHAISDRARQEPDFGILDITLYRDDIALEINQPIVRQTDIPFEVSGRNIILVDDVLYTGRTVRAALDALIDFGRPRAIRLAVLVDRGLREFPIRPDFVGLEIATTPDQKVHVRLKEQGESSDQVILEKGD